MACRHILTGLRWLSELVEQTASEWQDVHIHECKLNYLYFCIVLNLLILL